MLILPLEPTDDVAQPAFKDAISCSLWLGQLQLTNIQLAHSLLLTQLNEFNRYPLGGIERFNTIELLRQTVGYVQGDYEKKIIGKPLPLNENELMVITALMQLWRSMVVGYQRCLQAYLAGDKRLAKHGAILCQRCILYSGLELLVYLRSGYEFDPDLWEPLHGLYAFAEEQNLHNIEVDDSLNHKEHYSNCSSAYVKILLISYARPSELTRYKFRLMDIWLAQWSSIVTISSDYTAEVGVPELAVDLDGSSGLMPANQITQRSTVRYFMMECLSNLIREKINMLQQGQTPHQAGLCDYCNSHDCLELLSFIHQFLC